jgi:peptidoglycan/LPS O-acetylase OafA/YrhL
MKYRKDIDGLRSLAVVPVLFFHAGFSLFSGGYIGVDIFFVISGFLITQILLRELTEDRFSILRFYQRRARRILPALFSILLVTTLFAALIIPPELFREYGQSLVSVGVFASNIFFYQETGYFGFTAEKMPLLHTWSLAVEEQFYIFVPPLLFLLYRLGLSALGIAFAVLSLISLCWSQYLLSDQQQGSSFFLIMSRTWELLAGSLIAIYQLDKKKVSQSFAQGASLLGFVLIAGSMFLYQPHTPFPGVSALLPVLGTFLIISFCRQGTLVFQVLSLAPMVWIGLISYSLYLVHQPVFALSRFLSVAEPTASVFAGLILLSILLAYGNYRYVEKPLRQPERFSERFILLAGATGCAVVVLIGLFIHFKQGLPERYGVVPVARSIQPSPMRAKCHAEGVNLSAANACQLNGPHFDNWAVLGDSHGVELAYELSKRLDTSGVGLTQYTLSSCPPALLHKLKMPGCSKWQQEVLELITANNAVSTVVLIFRSSAFISGKNIKHYPEVPDEDRSFEFEFNGKDVSKEQSYQMFWENYQHLVEQLLAARKRVILIDPLPELPLDIRQLIYPKELFSGQYHLPLDNTTPLSFYQNRNKFILQQLDTMPHNPGLLRVSPLPVFCNSEYCSAVKGNKSLYFDDDHPSLYGAGLLADYVLEQNKQQP